MIFISAEKLHFVCYLSIGLLSLSLLTKCSKIRLVGPSRCAGRVEIYHEDRWGTVCDDLWSIANAEVVCRELNCGTVLEAKKGAFFGEGKADIWLDDVQCTGTELSILKCVHNQLGENNCAHSEDAGVICSEHVRLLNGTNRCSGRVEAYRNGQWKRICRNDWDAEEVSVVCREMNCGTPATSTEVLHFGEELHLDGLKTTCVGNESSISKCSFQEFKESCVDATVLCTNSKPIRLKNGTHRCTGRVEIFHDGQWGTVCDDKWGMQEATVACREMNCGAAIAVRYKAFFGRGSDQVWLDDVECTGHEKSLSDCLHRGFGEHDCDHNEDAGIICSDSVRLANGTDRCSGRVEVFHDDSWVKICNSNNWGDEEANLVCRELGCGNAKIHQQFFNFGESGLKGYTNRCSGNISSIGQCTLKENTARCETVSLTCSGVPPLRLVNGTNRCSGRVEILHDGQWGTVCDDEWDIKDAEVVCRAMDCGTAQTAKSSGFFGQGNGDIWLDDVDCIGNETSILHCRHPTLGENNCGHSEDAGVVCSADIRLVNGSNQCSGRVEFHYGGRWAAAYNVNWGRNEAAVVCREMNCGDPVKFSGSFGRGGLTGYKVTCVGGERSLSQCTVGQYSSNNRIEEAGVECSGNVKLSNGSNRCAGRVEYYDKSQWGTVCSESWDKNDGTVVCRQLGCGSVHKLTTSNEFGHGTGQTWIDQIECNGMESTLAQCQQRPYQERTCNTTSIAGVICTGGLEARLVNTKDECAGRVEVRHGNVWQTVCDTDWNLNKAQMVCELLECGHAMNAPGAAHFGQGSGPVVQASPSCFDNVTSLQQCSLNGFRSATCGHDRDAGVLCAAQLRLVGGSGQCSGRVEIHHKGQWGTVCDDEWEMTNGDVVCRQLGCGHAVSAPTSAHFGRGTGPIWLDNVQCTGQEAALTHCTHPGFGENNCGHGEDAGVICLGALHKPQIALSPSPEVNWGEKVEITCTVVSEQLGGTFVLKKTDDSFKLEKFSENEAVTFTFPAVDFGHKGSYFCEYQKKLPSQVIYYPQGNVAELSVIVKMEVPSITLTSPHAMVIYSPDKVSVTQGSTFFVTCSTHSSYPGGLFYLTKSNTTADMKTAFGHSVFFVANFEFPVIEYEHQGEYTCVYAVNISSLTFRSVPSKKLQITVVAASSSSVVLGVLIGIVVLLLMLGIGYFIWRRRWQGVGAMVQFSNTFGGQIKHDEEDRNNKMFNGRDPSVQVKEHGHSSGLEDKKADADRDNTVERGPEDLAGRVCYELEPLVVT
ncbi:Deleted in malignant brain tumors 1 protein [Collichthys lucidus]|uniref:Soluble scavenger receptor cysteine-rich domain-containing protein SSC5D n=1 Tax=Collichthys lucidus TaxID=240159 RepID=A0A4U5UPY7_COLLU|nr:Deleted in malignant brain tumors 1 protein [Collichthys lucidus]